MGVALIPGRQIESENPGFGGSGRPRAAGKLLKTVGSFAPPIILRAFPAARGRPEPRNPGLSPLNLAPPVRATPMCWQMRDHSQGHFVALWVRGGAPTRPSSRCPWTSAPKQGRLSWVICLHMGVALGGPDGERKSWIFGVWAAPGNRETTQKGRASPPTFLRGLPAARGRPDPPNRRSPVGQQNRVSKT